MNFTAAALKFRTEHVWDEESGLTIDLPPDKGTKSLQEFPL